jgi:hypothetical protein
MAYEGGKTASDERGITVQPHKLIAGNVLEIGTDMGGDLIRLRGHLARHPALLPMTDRRVLSLGQLGTHLLFVATAAVSFALILAAGAERPRGAG